MVIVEITAQPATAEHGERPHRRSATVRTWRWPAAPRINVGPRPLRVRTATR
jgi:hypothetical protein